MVFDSRPAERTNPARPLLPDTEFIHGHAFSWTSSAGRGE